MKTILLSILFRVFNKTLKVFIGAWPHKNRKHENQNVSDFFRQTPTGLRYLRIDVGLSDDASHSVETLLDYDDRMCIGIEPHPDNIAKLIKGCSKFYAISLSDNYVRKGHLLKPVKDIRRRFLLVEGAAGSCKRPTKRKFYSAFPDRGNSSLYDIHSIEGTGNISDKVIEVTEFQLSDILAKVDYERFPFIESLKIDTEGHELEVLKGCGKYLKKILYCRVECFRGFYANTVHVDPSKRPKYQKVTEDGFADSASAISDYLEKQGFELISSKPGEYTYINCNLKHLLLEHEVFP